MIELGDIQATAERRQIGDVTHTYLTDWQWIGPPVAQINFRLLDEPWRRHEVGDTFAVGPFRVQVTEYHPEGYYVVRRLDKYRLESWLRAKRLTTSQTLSWVVQSIVLTLAIWGLAEWPHGEIPSWKHVRKRWVKGS